MTKLFESKKAVKELERAPREIKRAYEIWARLVELHGTVILRQFSGYRDEALSGNWTGFRSCRFNKKWRVIYHLHQSSELEVVRVERVSAHDYRRK